MRNYSLVRSTENRRCTLFPWCLTEAAHNNEPCVPCHKCTRIRSIVVSVGMLRTFVAIRQVLVTASIGIGLLKKSCEFCDVVFFTSREDKRFCTRSCKGKAYYNRVVKSQKRIDARISDNDKT